MHIKELLSQARTHGAAIVLLQSLVCRGHGTPEERGFMLWRSNCAGKKKDGARVAINKSWLPKGCVTTRTEIRPGRILSVRVKAPKVDLTIV